MEDFAAVAVRGIVVRHQEGLPPKESNLYAQGEGLKNEISEDCNLKPPSKLETGRERRCENAAWGEAVEGSSGRISPPLKRWWVGPGAHSVAAHWDGRVAPRPAPAPGWAGVLRARLSAGPASSSSRQRPRRHGWPQFGSTQQGLQAPQRGRGRRCPAGGARKSEALLRHISRAPSAGSGAASTAGCRWILHMLSDPKAGLAPFHPSEVWEDLRTAIPHNSVATQDQQSGNPQ